MRASTRIEGALLVCIAVACAACASSRHRPTTPPPADPLDGVTAGHLHDRGLAYAERGDLVRAEQYLAAAIQKGYPAERALPELLEVCVRASRLRAALRYAEPFLADHPADWPLRYLVASIELALGDVDAAQSGLEEVITVAPDQAEAYFLLGIVLRDHRGDRRGAARRFREYLARADAGAPHAAEARKALHAPRRRARRRGRGGGAR